MPRLVLIVLVAVLVVGSIASIGAVAQDNASNETAEADTEPSGTWIDPDSTVMLVEGYVENGEAVLVLYATESQRVVVTDRFQSGVMNRETFYLNEGENTLRMPVNTVRGQTGVTIDTGTVLWGEPLSTGSTLLPSSYGLGSLLAAAAVGGVSGVLVLARLLSYVSNKMLKRRDL